MTRYTVSDATARCRPGRRQRLSAIGSVALLCLAIAASARAADRVYWSNQGILHSISFANLDGSGGAQLSTTGATMSFPTGVAIDPTTGRIYWANDGADTISFADLDGGGGGNLSIAGAPIGGPAGVAIDPGAGRLYWGDNGNSTISFAALDGSGGGQLAGATPGFPSGVAIDTAAGRIYWADGGSGTISYAALDGSGGGDLTITGATLSSPAGVAIDPVGGRIYWANFDDDSIAFAALDGSGGGDLTIAGATVSTPFGLAIDPVAGRLYWANRANHTIAFANLDGSSGGQLDVTGATPNLPSFLALLATPVGAGAPAVSGGGQPGQELTCSQGSWAPDLTGSQLYRAPRSVSYQWRKDGEDVTGATQSTYTPTTPGAYSCRVTATNAAGSASQTSAPVTVARVSPTLSTQASADVPLGGSVHATVVLAAGQNPTGQLTFRLHGPDDADCSAAPVFSETTAVAGNGTYDSAAVVPTVAGVYRFTAAYSGDEDNESVESGCDDPGASVTVSEVPAPPPPSAGCADDATYDAILCRLDELSAAVDAADLGRAQAKAVRLAARARAKTQAAQATDEMRRKRRRLAAAARALRRFARTLGSRPARESAARDTLRAAAIPLREDVRALRRTLR